MTPHKLLNSSVLLSAALLFLSTPAAAQIAFNDTLGPGGKFTLDVNLFCNGVPLTLVGPVKVDLGGHTLTCVQAGNDGTVIQGKGAKLSNGTVDNCEDGILVDGEGRHQLESVVVSDATADGILVLSPGNRFEDVTIRDPGGDGFFVHPSANKQRIKQCSVVRAGNDGFRVISANNRIQDSVADFSGDDGFVVLGEKNRLERVTASSNANGIVLVGPGGRIRDGLVRVGKRRPLSVPPVSIKMTTMSRKGHTHPVPGGREARRWCQTASDPATSSSDNTPRCARESVGTGKGSAQRSAQSISARVAHSESQFVSQQNESAAQTSAQHESSSQEGELLALQQSPFPSHITPLHTPPLQIDSARSAQFSSQVLLQQEPSWAQTSWQHIVSSQAGDPLSVQQSPGPGHVAPLQTAHNAWAVPAQVASQAKQQKLSRLQTS
jgi:hypothetical protein